MKTEKMADLVDSEKYQVFLMACPGNIPVSFATHAWFVVNKKGEVARWEVLFRKMEHATRWGHLYKNYFATFSGIEIIPLSKKLLWKGRLLGQIEGEAAKEMIEFIENSPTNYPFCDKYFLLGPNSNTYIQWVLNSFPEFPARLPWNAFGKNYNI